MVHFTVNSTQLAEKDIYAIEEVKSLNTLLEEKHSLCLVHAPVFRKRGDFEMIRVGGYNEAGDPDKIWFGKCGLAEQGYLRCKLDRVLSSPFLFATWKKSGHHEIRIIHNHNELGRFQNFDDALKAYLPDGFRPTYSYTRKRSVFVLFFLAQKRRQTLKELVTLLSMYRDRELAI